MLENFATDTGQGDGSVVFCPSFFFYLSYIQGLLRHFSSHLGPHLLSGRQKRCQIGWGLVCCEAPSIYGPGARDYPVQVLFQD